MKLYPLIRCWGKSWLKIPPPNRKKEETICLWVDESDQINEIIRRIKNETI